MSFYPKWSEDPVWCVLFILLTPAMIIGICFMIFAPFWIVWLLFHQPKTFELSVKEWECTATYEKRVFTGKMWITQTLCANYSLIGANGD